MTGVDAITAEHVDEVLATTRAVRRRLDLDRPVDNQLLLDCIDLAEQAPTGGNLGSRRWIIVRDQGVKDQLGELYRETALPFMAAAAERLTGLNRRSRTGLDVPAGGGAHHPHRQRNPCAVAPPARRLSGGCTCRHARDRGEPAVPPGLPAMPPPEPVRACSASASHIANADRRLRASILRAPSAARRDGGRLSAPWISCLLTPFGAYLQRDGRPPPGRGGDRGPQVLWKSSARPKPSHGSDRADNREHHCQHTEGDDPGTECTSCRSTDHGDGDSDNGDNRHGGEELCLGGRAHRLPADGRPPPVRTSAQNDRREIGSSASPTSRSTVRRRVRRTPSRSAQEHRSVAVLIGACVSPGGDDREEAPATAPVARCRVRERRAAT